MENLEMYSGAYTTVFKDGTSTSGTWGCSSKEEMKEWLTQKLNEGKNNDLKFLFFRGVIKKNRDEIVNTYTVYQDDEL